MLAMDNPVFIILSFEGPDRYAHVGGLGTRVAELSSALADEGFETHVFFIGDPALPGHETNGNLHLHRWCQWLSEYHPGGVYVGEDAKLEDWTRSLPPWLENELLAPHVAAGRPVVVLAEEWQTAASVIALHHRIALRGWDGNVHILWNANNTFSFDRIDWAALKKAATITTVSRYMKHLMWPLGVDAEVVPNGIPASWLSPVSRRETDVMAKLFRGRLPLVKLARWDPDKRWKMAVDAVALLKRQGYRPLFVARGGSEPHGQEVLANVELHGLRAARVDWNEPTVDAMAEALAPALEADMLILQPFLNQPQRRVLFRAASAVLANSGREPFGLVGLETMAVGGVAMVGSTGEDYATPGHDAIALQTDSPSEIISHIERLSQSPEDASRMRQAARRSAARYTWAAVIRRLLLPLIARLSPRPRSKPSPSLLRRRASSLPAATSQSTLRAPTPQGNGVSEVPSPERTWSTP